jgi:hypothetical protein
MNEQWCVWLPDERDVYRREERNRPPEEALVWTTRALGEAEAKAGHLGGRVVRVDVMKRNYEALRRGRLRAAASFCARPIEHDADLAR